jgi:hypothetical protein
MQEINLSADNSKIGKLSEKLNIQKSSLSG